MNTRYLNIFTLITSCTILMIGCSEDNSSFETPNNSVVTNSGVASQTNFTVGSTDPFPAVYDPATGFTEVTVEIVAKVGDRKNQLLTDAHTIYFKTEWGLIQPSCTTVDGKCSVTWQTSKFDNIPSDLLNTVTAWTIGEESFTDSNGNGVFDDEDTVFEDLEEPFVNADNDINNIYSAAAGDILIDVINGNDPTGKNGEHDIGDTFLNSPNCTHSSLCSIRKSTYIWGDTVLYLGGPPTTP